MRKPIYLDYAATTPVAPSVAQAMMQCLTLGGVFANPASRSHAFGWQAEEKVEGARNQVAELIGADSREIVWTSGATEANNLALKGAAEHYRKFHATGGHIVVSAIEHKAVLDPAHWLQEQGFSVTYIAPDDFGFISPESIAAARKEDTFLVSVMLVNNELGAINDIASIGQWCRANNILLHTDAAQAAGKIAIDVNALYVDLLSLSAHKFYGPKGVGALYVRRAENVNIAAQIHGGGHERKMRSGTLPTHQLVGMGEASALAQAELKTDQKRLLNLREKLWNGIKDIPGIQRNSAQENTVYSILNVGFAGEDGEMLLIALRDLAISSGSACNSATMSPSYVLKAVGIPDALAQASLRISLGRYTQEDEIKFAVETICSVLAKLHA